MNPLFKNVKTVLFDFGGTLDADGLDWKTQFYPFYLKAGFDWTFLEYQKHFFASDDYLTEKTLKSHSFSKTVHLQVYLVLKSAGVYNKKISDQIANGYLKQSIRNLKAKIPFLKRLKKKYRLGIVSNFYGNLPVICREIGYDKIFDAIIDSNRVACLKPDPKIFWAALKKLKAAPAETVFVGDSGKRDMLGAKGLGMKHILILNKNSKEWRTCCPGDLTLQSVGELKGILL